MVWEKTVEYSKIAHAKRTCQKCNTNWGYTEKIEARESREIAYPEAEDDRAEIAAQHDLDFKESTVSKDCDHKVICPRCGFFAIQTIKRYFSAGFYNGMKAIEKDRLLESSLLFLFCSLVFFGSTAGLIYLSTEDSSGSIILAYILPTISTITGLVFGYFFLREIFYFFPRYAKLSFFSGHEDQSEEYAQWAAKKYYGNIVDHVFTDNLMMYLDLHGNPKELIKTKSQVLGKEQSGNVKENDFSLSDEKLCGHVLKKLKEDLINLPNNSYKAREIKSKIDKLELRINKLKLKGRNMPLPF